jgi:energy-coupling factor transporter ATP-binding protein EcfA2
MFCHTVLPRGGQTIFAIDEPELSLNVKWQRKLIRALQEVVGDSHVQFVFASHSMEFLSEHLEKVVELIPTKPVAPALPMSGDVSGSSNNS